MSRLERKVHELQSENSKLTGELEELACSYSVLLEKYRKLKSKYAQLQAETQADKPPTMLATSLCGSKLKTTLSLKKNPSQRMFEAFFILGLSIEQVHTRPAFHTPIVLETYPNNAGYQTALISTFAFPTGYTINELDFSRSGTQLYKLMYPSYERDRNSYIFCIKSQEVTEAFGISGISNNSKEVLYGCCVVQEALGPAVNGFVQVIPTCYCILSYVPCFELHFQVLYSLLSVKKAQALKGSPRAELTQRVMQDSSTGLTYEQEMLLAEYYHDFAVGIRRSYTIAPQIIESIQVQLPDNLEMLDTEWTCSLVLSILTVDEFFQILSAVLLEKSVLFVSENLAYVSSCVLGIEALLKPLKWPFVVSPILPQALYIALESPVPILAGVAEDITQISKHSKLIRVLLDKKSDRIFGKAVTEPSANNLKEYLRPAFRVFNKACYNPEKAQLKAVYRVAHDIKNFLLGVLGGIPKPTTSVKQLKHSQFSAIKRRVVQRGDPGDVSFLKHFVNTQMFVAYVESLYLSL